MEELVFCNDYEIIRRIFGPQDSNIRLLEDYLGVKIILKGDGILVRGNANKVKGTVHVLKKIIEKAENGEEISEKDIKSIIEDINRGDILSNREPVRIEVPSKKKFILARTPGQIEYIEAIYKHDIIFSLGPAGTGKTYLAMAMAVNYLSKGRVGRIILTRPAIEAGESLGFLPGGVSEKLGPYLKPLYDALYEMMEPTFIEECLETGVIEIAPLAYMRGRTLNNAFIILDEAQNCTSEQMKMFLTRLGFDSKTVITGDMTQSDLPGGNPTGLIEAIKILKHIKDIKFIHLTKKDVVRHPLIQKIIEAYEEFYKYKEEKK